MTFLGMDVEQADEHAAATRTAQQRIQSILEQLSVRIALSSQHWIGPDAEDFRARWVESGEAPGRDLVTALERSVDDLVRHVQEQEQASAPGGSTSSSAGDGGATTGPVTARGERHGGGGEVSPEVDSAWKKMSDKDQQKVLQEVVDQELRRYGHDGLTVHFDRNTGYSGYWTEFDRRRPFRGEHIVIDRAHALEASSLNTAAHEARHAAQDRWIEETNPSGFWFWRDEKEAEYAEIEENHGITRADVDAFRENDKDYIEAPKAPPQEAPDEEWRQYQEDYDAYRYQPLEGDAWDEGDRFAEELTVEQLQQYQRDAGVPVTTP